MNHNISNSNIKLILEFYFKNKNTINIHDLYEYYQPTQGFLYCLFNEIFKFYGDDLYKCGNSIDTDKRLCQFTTSYPEPSTILLTSDCFFDKFFAETLLFYYLNDFFFKHNREFIKCNLQIIKDAFDKVSHFFSIYKTKQLLIDFLLIDNNFKMFFSKQVYNLSSSDKLKKNTHTINNILNILKINNDVVFNDENDFIIVVYKYLFQLNFYQFHFIFDKHYNSFSKYKYILDNIYTCFWFEDLLNIKRFDVNNIKDIDLENITKIFIKEINKFISIFANYQSEKKTKERIINKINSIDKINLLQKFIADCYNFIYNESIKITYKRVNIDINRKMSYYTFLY